MALTLTKNYRARCPFNPSFGIGDDENSMYLDSLAKWHMLRIKQSAKPYHEKHLGVADNGKRGKVVAVTHEEIKQLIIDANGVSPDGTKIYFGSLGCLNNPSRAIALGLMTSDENSRKPSFDRIDSDKPYIKDNLQHTTKGYNIGKGSDDSYSTVSQNIKVRVKNIEFIIDNCSPQFLAHYTQSLAN